MLTIEELQNRFARSGSVAWIGLRPERRAPVAGVERAEIETGGLVGDHRAKAGARAVTLVQFEHLAVVAALMNRECVDPALLRRNIAVAGISVAALRGREFRIGGATLKGIEACAPCSRMEEALGSGGYNAMRGHGGLCAAVIGPGEITLGDAVTPLGPE